MLKALIVDDAKLNREILADLLCDDFEIIEADNGEQALDIISKDFDNIAVLLLDLYMPIIDGFGVLESLFKSNRILSFPIIIITSATDRFIEEKCLELGVTDFIRKPYNDLVAKARVKNAVELYSLKNNLQKKVEEQTEILNQQNLRLVKFNDDLVYLLGSVVEARNKESGLHIQRVTKFSEIIAQDVKINYPEYLLTDESVKLIKTASALHDIGKIMISDGILLKPGKLTKDEFEIMKQHSELGVNLLKLSSNLWDADFYSLCEDICHYHHERWDGKGYPEGLIGDNIPISAQIVALADSFDALVTERVYKKPFSIDKAYEMIQNGECGQFSPKILQSFSRCICSMKQLVINNTDLIN